MKVSQALLSRRSVRAFLDQPIDKSLLVELLEAAKWAPSGVNMQPWQVYVVSGEAKQRLSDQLLAAFQSGNKSQMDYQYYPLRWKPVYKQRQLDLGKQMFTLLDIAREDKAKRLAQWGRNYLGFDAPTLLIFSIDESLEKGSYLDYGMFLQSIMLMAKDLGLETCPQAALVEQPKILQAFLNTADNEKFICGMAIGYADSTAVINQLKPERANLDSFSQFID